MNRVIEKSYGYSWVGVATESEAINSQEAVLSVTTACPNLIIYGFGDARDGSFNALTAMVERLPG